MPQRWFDGTPMVMNNDNSVSEREKWEYYKAQEAAKAAQRDTDAARERYEIATGQRSQGNQNAYSQAAQQLQQMQLKGQWDAYQQQEAARLGLIDKVYSSALQQDRDATQQGYQVQAQQTATEAQRQRDELLNYHQQGRDWRQAGYQSQRDYEQAVYQAQHEDQSAWNRGVLGEQQDLRHLQSQGMLAEQQAGYQTERDYRQQGFDQQRQVTAAELQAQLHRTNLTVSEEMRRQSLERQVGIVQQSVARGEFSEADGANMITQLRTGLDPLQERYRQGQLTTQALEQTRLQEQNAMAASHNRVMRDMTAPGIYDPQTGVATTGNGTRMIHNGNAWVQDPMQLEELRRRSMAEAAAERRQDVTDRRQETALEHQRTVRIQSRARHQHDIESELRRHEQAGTHPDLMPAYLRTPEAIEARIRERVEADIAHARDTGDFSTGPQTTPPGPQQGGAAVPPGGQSGRPQPGPTYSYSPVRPDTGQPWEGQPTGGGAVNQREELTPGVASGPAMAGPPPPRNDGGWQTTRAERGGPATPRDDDIFGALGQPPQAQQGQPQTRPVNPVEYLDNRGQAQFAAVRERLRREYETYISHRTRDARSDARTNSQRGAPIDMPERPTPRWLMWRIPQSNPESWGAQEFDRHLHDEALRVYQQEHGPIRVPGGTQPRPQGEGNAPAPGAQGGAPPNFQQGIATILSGIREANDSREGIQIPTPAEHQRQVAGLEEEARQRSIETRRARAIEFLTANGLPGLFGRRTLTAQQAAEHWDSIPERARDAILRDARDGRKEE